MLLGRQILASEVPLATLRLAAEALVAVQPADRSRGTMVYAPLPSETVIDEMRQPARRGLHG